MWVWKKAKIIMGMQVLLPKPTASVGVDMHQQWITAKVNPWTYCLRCINFHIHTAEAECLNLSDKTNFEMPLLLWEKKKVMSLLMIAHCTLQLSGLPLHAVLVTHDAENAAQIHTECSRCRPRSLIVFFSFFFSFQNSWKQVYIGWAGDYNHRLGSLSKPIYKFSQKKKGNLG